MPEVPSLEGKSMEEFDAAMTDYMNSVGENIYNEFNVEGFIEQNSDMVQGIAKNGVALVKEVADENDLKGLVDSADNTFNSACAQFDAKAKQLDRTVRQVANNELELSKLEEVTLGEVKGLTENIEKIQGISLAAIAQSSNPNATLIPVAKSLITPALAQSNLIKKQLIARQNDLLLATRAVRLEAKTVLKMAEEVEEMGVSVASLKVAKETCGVLSTFGSAAQKTLAATIGSMGNVKEIMSSLPGIMQQANVDFLGSVLETGALQSLGVSLDSILSSLGISGLPSLGSLLGNIGGNLASAISNIPASVQDEIDKGIKSVGTKVSTTGVAKPNKEQSKNIIKATLSGVDPSNLGQALDVLSRTAYKR